MRHALREPLARLTLLAGGILAGLALLEVGLHVAAAYNARAGRRDLAALVAGRRRVLMLGDSNTYGLYVPAADAYPHVLERMWNRVHPDDPIEVLNFAYPGMNSSRLRQLFPDIVETVRPDLALVMIGANDIWTVPEPPSDSAGSSIRQVLWRYSRVYRLLFMLGRELAPPRLELTSDVVDVSRERVGRGVFRYGSRAFEMGFRGLRGDPEERDMRSDLLANLREIVEDARQEDVDVALLTYPTSTGIYGGVSGMIRRAANAIGVPLVEMSPALPAACHTGTCPELFPDGHPTIAGHRRAGKYLARALRRERLLAPRVTASRRR